MQILKLFIKINYKDTINKKVTAKKWPMFRNPCSVQILYLYPEIERK